MPKVNIDVPSKFNAQDTFTKIKKLFDESSDLKKFDPQMACTFNDSQMSGVAKGGKFSAELKVNGSGDNSAVSIVLDLPLLLSPFKGQIKSTVEKKLNALLA
ncbi:MAG: polyhydroxyalkanoic acid system family protein [Bdellovibrionaceae bacterium]|nr:polyhydroxyalkanoic acid system family protein [Pseudobdellovibrionaceae bacterium]